MTDHAKTIAAIREAENQRMNQMELGNALLHWLVYLLAFSVCCYEVFK